MRNEVRLFSFNATNQKPWEAARNLIKIAERLVNTAARDGLPAHESATRWRSAEMEEKNGQVTLFGLLDSLARAAYPLSLLRKKSVEGGWEPGPIKIPEFNRGYGFVGFLQRVIEPNMHGWIGGPHYFAPFPGSPVFSMFSRLSVENAILFGQQLSGADFEGSSFERTQIIGCTIAHSDFTFVNFKSTKLNYSKFIQTTLTGSDLTGVDLEQTYFDETTLKRASFTPTVRRRVAKARKTFRTEFFDG